MSESLSDPVEMNGVRFTTATSEPEAVPTLTPFQPLHVWQRADDWTLFRGIRTRRKTLEHTEQMNIGPVVAVLEYRQLSSTVRDLQICLVRARFEDTHQIVIG